MSVINEWLDLSEAIEVLINRINRDSNVRYRLKIDLAPAVRSIIAEYGIRDESEFSAYTDAILRDTYINITVEDCLNKLDRYKKESLLRSRNALNM